MSFISNLASLTDTKLSRFVPLYILNIFTEGFVLIQFFFITSYFKNMVKMHLFSDVLSDKRENQNHICVPSQINTSLIKCNLHS